MRPELAQFFESRYETVKTTHPSAGRRKWHLLLLEQFWASSPSPPAQTTQEVDETLIDHLTQDGDQFDTILSNVEGGVVVRTDFSDEGAWKAFCEKLKQAEEEMIGGDGGEQTSGSNAEDASAGDVGMAEDDDDSDDGEEGTLVKVINPELPEERAIFEGISNLTALRLLNDIDIRPSPPLPPDTKRVSPSHRLVDHRGWQEIYTGVNVWIYDAKSNTDKSVRLVSQEGDVYGTATGDSWRAQVSHIYDLQFNMTFTGLKINFGGMDRWDYSERKRNLDEALVPIL